jgi:hypothetical protein
VLQYYIVEISRHRPKLDGLQRALCRALAARDWYSAFNPQRISERCYHLGNRPVWSNNARGVWWLTNAEHRARRQRQASGIGGDSNLQPGCDPDERSTLRPVVSACVAQRAAGAMAGKLVPGGRSHDHAISLSGVAACPGIRTIQLVGAAGAIGEGSAPPQTGPGREHGAGVGANRVARAGKGLPVPVLKAACGLPSSP